jgi:hypothetical protein
MNWAERSPHGRGARVMKSYWRGLEGSYAARRWRGGRPRIAVDPAGTCRTETPAPGSCSMPPFAGARNSQAGSLRATELPPTRGTERGRGHVDEMGVETMSKKHVRQTWLVDRVGPTLPGKKISQPVLGDRG